MSEDRVTGPAGPAGPAVADERPDGLDPTAAAGHAAQIAWFATLGAQAERDRAAPAIALPPPAQVAAARGRGQVTVSWSPVEQAAGYLVLRGTAPDGPFEVIDQGGGDVLAVPHGPYLDTTGADQEAAWYAVASIADVEADHPVPSVAVPAVTSADDGRVTVSVDAADVRGVLPRPWRPMIGSEHLALLLRNAGPGGSDVGRELAEAFRIAHAELGARFVRAHGILHDSLGVYREVDGRPVHDFTGVDAVLDRLLETGLRPIVELSFMPRDLASDPDRTVFAYGGIISPPRDWDRWTGLVRELVAHLAERYGRDEVAEWAFEVWNEPNLGLFWDDAESAYLRLYDASAAAVKAVDSRFRVGGPATAAAAWVDDLLAHCAETGTPIDFITTHTYGMPPLDLRPITARFGRPDLPLWWTEWGVSPSHGAALNDSPWGAPLVARGMRSGAGRLDAISYWVASDHFVELGEAEGLFHGGFGLLTIGNLRKPRFWAIAMLESLGTHEVACALDGDGASSLVEAWASIDDDGRVAVACWNGTLAQTNPDGDPRLERRVALAITGLAPGGRYVLRHWRVDATHSNIRRRWEELGAPEWPDADGWAALQAADRLELLEPVREVTATDGRIELEVVLPMPAISRIDLVPRA